MTVIYAYKWPIVVILAGLVVRSAANMIRILHWFNSDLLILTGTVLIITGLVWILIRVSLLAKP